MYSILAAILLASSFAVATPTGTFLPEPGCTIISPSAARVEEARPGASYLPGFIIAQDAGATNKKDAFVEFTVPENSWGCTLEAVLPPGYPVASSGNTQVYVYSTNRAFTRSPFGIDISWVSSPQKVSQVGTVTFRSDPYQPTKVVINSFACKPKMTFRLSIGSLEQAGYVEFEQTDRYGLRMTYNC